MKYIKTFENFGGNMKPIKDQEFPCTFTIMTDKERGGSLPTSIKNNGYHFLVDNQEELDDLKSKYVEGGDYQGEKIISTTVNDANYGEF